MSDVEMSDFFQINIRYFLFAVRYGKMKFDEEFLTIQIAFEISFGARPEGPAYLSTGRSPVLKKNESKWSPEGAAYQ